MPKQLNIVKDWNEEHGVFLYSQGQIALICVLLLSGWDDNFSKDNFSGDTNTRKEMVAYIYLTTHRWGEHLDSYFCSACITMHAIPNEEAGWPSITGSF